MNVFKKVFVNTLLGLFFYPVLSQAEICPTHIACTPGKECSCTLSTEGSYERYFYFDVSQMLSGKIYDCQLSSNLGAFTYYPDASRYPEGVEATCSGGNCPQFPMTLKIDTQQMKDSEGTAIIKYIVGPSDIVENVRINCSVEDADLIKKHF